MPSFKTDTVRKMYFFGCFYRGGGAGELVGLKMTVDLSCYTINRLDEISNVILK